MVVQLPLLELTSCQYCEYIIPLNMLNIHQVIFLKFVFIVYLFYSKNTCDKNPVCLHNRARFSQQQQPLTDSCMFKHNH